MAEEALQTAKTAAEGYQEELATLQKELQDKVRATLSSRSTARRRTPPRGRQAQADSGREEAAKLRANLAKTLEAFNKAKSLAQNFKATTVSQQAELEELRSRLEAAGGAKGGKGGKDEGWDDWGKEDQGTGTLHGQSRVIPPHPFPTRKLRRRLGG